MNSARIKQGAKVNREEREVLATITEVNSELARYLLRLLDVTNGMSEAGFPPEREAALGERLVVVGKALQTRAQQRLGVVLKGTATAGEVEPSRKKPGISEH